MTEKNKVAIMTWHTYFNYGSALQASALYRVIESMGYKPDFIDYLPKGNLRESVKISFCKKILDKVYRKLTPIYKSFERGERFKSYMNERVSYSERCNSYPELHDLNSKYSAFICGSDQIWSPLCFDSKYFLDFVENTEKMIAYAPSIGSESIENEIIRGRMIQNISRFKHLSIREKQGAQLIEKLTGQNARVVLDPTLLLNCEEWDSYANVQDMNKLPDGRYILCYFLGESSKYMKYVHVLSKRMEVPFYVIPQTVREKKNGNAIPFEVGPSDFVSLIKNSAYVCTDSFHGMAFSINYNIPFSVFKRFSDNDSRNQNSRIFNLLSLLKLETRLTETKRKYAEQIIIDCDFTLSNMLLEELRTESKKYLKNALDAACSNRLLQNEEYKITDYCCGCGACATVCSKDAISIIKDKEGFEQCSINSSKCVRCGQCKTVCPMTNISASYMDNAKALYAMKSLKKNVLKKSASGGVGYELATALSEQNYSVCGCTYDTASNSAKHIWLSPADISKISLLQGSKYIQSKCSDAMLQLKEQLKIHNLLFLGTPCQAAAVDKILRISGQRESAVIVDLICHGVPSMHLWNKYLKEINRKYQTGEHPLVLFRSKEKEWRRRLLLVSGNGHTYKKEEHSDDFYAFFRRNLCYMKSCFECPYRERSAADIRIGDYWGTRFENDKEGVSMVIANTALGQKLVEGLVQNRGCQLEQLPLNDYWSVQYPYNLQRPLVREQLIQDLKNEQTNLHKLRKKYCAYYDFVEKCIKIIAFLKREIIDE